MNPDFTDTEVMFGVVVLDLDLQVDRSERVVRYKWTDRLTKHGWLIGRRRQHAIRPDLECNPFL